MKQLNIFSHSASGLLNSNAHIKGYTILSDSGLSNRMPIGSHMDIEDVKHSSSHDKINATYL
jgi:hypothetical protein